MISGQKPSIGADPEFFIYRKIKDEDKLQLVTADKVLRGKDNKELCGTGCMCFFDGVQAEINPNPHACREFFASDIYECIRYVYNKAKAKYPDDKIIILPLASVDFNKRDMRGVDPECLRFGCNPDESIYGSREVKYPNGKEYTKRFSGGHFHLGSSNTDQMKILKDPVQLENLIKLFDAIPGIMSIAMSDGKEEVERRKYYGKAGTYRIQNHGIEYRTLSSFWLVSPPLTSLYSGLIRDCLNFLMFLPPSEIIMLLQYETRVKHTIDTSDKHDALLFYYENILPFYERNPISNSPIKLWNVDVINKMVDEGYRYYFKPEKTINYWQLALPTLGLSPSYGGIGNFTHAVRYKNINLDIINESE